MIPIQGNIIVFLEFGQNILENFSSYVQSRLGQYVVPVIETRTTFEYILISIVIKYKDVTSHICLPRPHKTL